jgi:hypothetical protein
MPQRVVRVRELPPDLRAQVMAAMSVPDAAPQPARRKRKLSFASFAKQAAKSGVVSRVEVDPESGKMVAVLGKPEIAPDVTEPNEWDTVQ